MEWAVVGWDIHTRKLSIAASGSKTVDIPADTDTEVTTGAFEFSTQEGQVERTNKKGSNNNPNKNRVKPGEGQSRHRDPLRRVCRDLLPGRPGLIAEASTAGLKDLIKGLQPAKGGKKKK